MAKKQRENILINQVNVKPIHRESLDIKKWRNAHRAAEGLNHCRKQLYEIYDEALIDGHLSSVIEKRQNSITNLELKFFDKNNKEVEEMDCLINSTYFEEMLKEVINAKFWGFTLLELDWSPQEGYQNKTYLVDRRHVKPEFGVVVSNPVETSGIDYTQHPFAMFVGGNDFGLLLKACPMVIYKRNNTGDWAEYNELFGRPYPHGKYTNDDTRQLLTEAFEKAGFGAYLVAPSDGDIVLNMPTSQNSIGSYKDLRDAMNEELSILFVGQNLTSKVTGGSHAAAETHLEVEESIHTADREFVVKYLNEKLIPVLNKLGWNIQGKFDFVYIDEMALTDRIAIDTQVANIIPVDPDYFYETYSIPKPTGEAAVQPKPQAKDKRQSDKNPKLSLLDFFSNLFSKKKKSFAVLVDETYQCTCSVCNLADGEVLLRDVNSLIEKALKNIYNQKVDITNGIEPNLFDITFKQLNLAIEKGFAGIEFNVPNDEFISQLKYNNAVFSAFKTHRQQNDLAANLLDANGELKSFANFKKDTEAIIGKYNEDWLKTEYNTAVIRARQAANFKKFEEDIDLFPNLKWLPSTSVAKRDLHVKFYDIVKPYGDPFWKEHFPGNLWNCKCGITNTDDVPDKETPTANYTPAPGLDENPGITGSLFSKTNPYRTDGYETPKKLDKIANNKASELFPKLP